MKHSTSYNSPGSLSSPVVIAAAFPSAAAASCSSSHSLRPQRWSRSHRTTPHQPQRPPNVTSSISTGLRANRTSARSLRGTQDKRIQRESINSVQVNNTVVQPSHVQRRNKQPQQQPNNTTSVESEVNVEEKAEDVTHDSVGVKATRKAKRRQTRRRRHTSPLQEKPEEEAGGHLSAIQSDRNTVEDVKTSVTAPAAQNESQPLLVSSTTQATKEAHKQEEEETPPKRRQRRPRRRAQQRQTRRQQSAKDVNVSTNVTATTPNVPKGVQRQEEKQVKDNGSSTTPTNTATTTASSVASSGPHDQRKPQSSRCNGEANALTKTTTEKPKRVRRRRQRRQKPRREAASSTQQQTQHPLPIVHERIEDNVVSTPAVVGQSDTEPSLALNKDAAHNPPSALPTHSPVAALFSVPPAALHHSAPTATTVISALNNVSRLTSAANEEERQEGTSRRVGALPVFPSRPDLTQLTYNELSLFDSTTAAAFSLSSGTGGVRGGDEDGESTSPMTLATSCSPTSIHAPASNGPHIASSNMQNNGVTTQEVVEDEVGLRRRGLRVRAVAFQPRNSSGDEKDNNNNTAGESTGASFGVRRRRGRRSVRPGSVLARHNYSVSDVDNVQHSCVAMSDVVAKDETLMFNMLVGNTEGDVDLVAGGDAAHLNNEAAAGNELNDDEEDDDEEEEEVLMDLCGLRGAVPRTAPMPRHIAPGGGYWSEDNYTNNNNSSSAVGGRSSYERSAYYYSMSYARAASRNSLTTSQSQVQPAHLHRQRSQPSLSYYETLTPQIAALLLPPAPNSASRDPSPTRTFRGTMSVMSTNEAMTDVDQWEMNSSVYEESLDEAQVQWIEEQLRASENPEGFFG